MAIKPIIPNPSSVRDACDRFDNNKYAFVDRALAELFGQYPTNDDEAHVLLKVVALNELYSTNIYAVADVACLIYEHRQEVDGALNPPSPEAVDQIVELLFCGMKRHFWAFATKYCSWHRPESYPIWDANVARYLRSLKGSPFTRPEDWTRYSQFVDLMQQFKNFYNLGEFTFKQIDKFLWLSGGDLMKEDQMKKERMKREPMNRRSRS